MAGLLPDKYRGLRFHLERGQRPAYLLENTGYLWGFKPTLTCYSPARIRSRRFTTKSKLGGRADTFEGAAEPENYLVDERFTTRNSQS
jgi:hypothetical protein